MFLVVYVKLADGCSGRQWFHEVNACIGSSVTIYTDSILYKLKLPPEAVFF